MLDKILKPILLYSIGLGLAALAYTIVGHGYAHGPGLHHLIILLTFVGGFIWLLVAIIQYIIGQRTMEIKGTIITTSLMSIGFILFIWHLTYSYQQRDKISVERSGEDLTIRRDGSIIYLREGDVVRINFMDSSRIDWEEVEIIEK